MKLKSVFFGDYKYKGKEKFLFCGRLVLENEFKSSSCNLYYGEF